MCSLLIRLSSIAVIVLALGCGDDPEFRFGENITGIEFEVVDVTEGIHPSCVWLPSGYGVFSRHLKTAYDQGLSYNDFLPTLFDPTVGHAMSAEIIVRVNKI